MRVINSNSVISEAGTVTIHMDFPNQMNKDIIKIILIVIGVIGIIGFIIWLIVYLIRLKQ